MYKNRNGCHGKWSDRRLNRGFKKKEEYFDISILFVYQAYS